MYKSWYRHRWDELIALYPFFAGRGIPGGYLDSYAFYNLSRRTQRHIHWVNWKQGNHYGVY